VSRWRATKASRVFAALQRIGWNVKREAKGSHKVLQREGFESPRVCRRWTSPGIVDTSEVRIEAI